MCMATAGCSSRSGADGDEYMRIYRDTTSNIVARAQIKDTGGVACTGIDTPGAGSTTYTVDILNNAGVTATMVLEYISISVFAVA